MSDGQTAEASTPLGVAAAQLHELFTTMLEAGFTEQQACRVLGCMLAESNGQNSEG